MPKSENQKPVAFVIMPFGEGFDEIYNLFLVGALTEAGYEVSRADDLGGSQNIVKGIVRGIKNNDLIVADLTDSNSNVFYELGLAHALNKPVILLTQEIKDLPFDLKSYRVISYKTHFAHIKLAREELTKLAADFLSGEAEFSSPVSDFLGQPVETIFQHLTIDSDMQEVGFLDHLADMEEGLERLTNSIVSFGSKTEELGQATSDITQRIESLGNKPGGASGRQLRLLVMSLAQKLSGYAKFLLAENDKYGPELAQTRTSLEAVVRAQDPDAQGDQKELKRFLSALDSAENNGNEALSSIQEMTDTLQKVPPVERTFNRAQEQAVKELRRFASNVEQTTSMIARAKEIAREILGEASEDTDQ